jgi:hypothetical protein
VLEDELRAAICGLAEVDHRAKLLLIVRAALFIISEVVTEIALSEISAEPLPSSASMLANKPVSLEQSENDFCLSLRHFSQLGDVSEGDRLIYRILLESNGNLRGFLHLGIFAAEEVGLNATVFDSV